MTQMPAATTVASNLSSTVTPVRPYAEDRLTRSLYPAAEWFFTLPEKVDGFVNRSTIRPPSAGTPLTLPSKIINGAVKGMGAVTKMMIDYDYREFPKLFKFSISEPPIGALILLLYPFTIGPRLIRAAERDKREIGDVMRRDLTAITIFLFALKPLVNGMNRLKEMFDGMKLVDTEAKGLFGKVFTYTQFDKLYTITNPNTLQAILENGNEKAVIRAINVLTDNGLAKHNYPQLQDKITALRKLAQDKLQNAAQKDVAGFSQEAFKIIEEMEALRKNPSTKLGTQLGHKVTKLVEDLPNFQQFFARYAKTRRLPIDALSFMAVIVGIGWFPVWFNAHWNKKQFEREQAVKRAANAANFDPALAYKALKQSSRLYTGNRQA